MIVAGVDGCHAGWVVVTRDLDKGDCLAWIESTFPDVLRSTKDAAAVAVDMPIGFLDAAEHGGRACDRRARALLSPHTSRVFSPPVRAVIAAFDCSDHMAACLINRDSAPARIGISKQVWNIVEKLREVDARMIPALQSRVREAHPEVSFRGMNRREPVCPKKKSKDGREARRILLRERGFAEIADMAPPVGAAIDDLLDACACCWTAGRIARGCAESLGGERENDARGLRREIVW